MVRDAALANKISQYAEISRTERMQPRDLIQKIKAGGSGGGVATRIYAKIIKGLSRGDTTVDPPVAKQENYKIELLGTAATAVWAAGVEYDKDDIVKYNRETVDPDTDEETTTWVYYKCKIAHTSDSDIKTPENSTYWQELSEEGLDAWVDGYDDDLLLSSPWFIIDQIVEVVYRKDFNSQGIETGSPKYRIRQTVRKVNYEDDGGYRGSIMWLESEEREAAVFG
jgi:hypothetical protein